MENVALRHQLAAYQRAVHRSHLGPTDRLFWACLCRFWSAWQDALAFVQLRTMIAWQRARFRDHWARLSQGTKPGRPVIAEEARELIRTMWRANPRQLATFERLWRVLGVVMIDQAVRDKAAGLYATLCASGQRIEDADLLIAAMALVHDMTLVNHNMAHFARISGLRVEDWLMP